MAFTGNEIQYNPINLDIVQDKKIRTNGSVYKRQNFSRLTVNYITLCINMELLKQVRSDSLGSSKYLSLP